VSIKRRHARSRRTLDEVGGLRFSSVGVGQYRLGLRFRSWIRIDEWTQRGPTSHSELLTLFARQDVFEDVSVVPIHRASMLC
jgi:hypothetical protein